MLTSERKDQRFPNKGMVVDESVQRWLTKISKKSGSINTRRAYLHYLTRFSSFARLKPDELIAERVEDLKSNDRFRRRRAEERLDGWFSDLEKQGLSRNTCLLAYTAVRSFYKSSYVALEIDEAPSAWPSKLKPGLTREELGTLIEHSSKQVCRAYILCQVQSGLSVSDLLRLVSGDAESQLEKNYVHLRLLRGKEKHLGFFDTFFGRMSTEALKEYLSTRKGLEGSSRLFPYTARGVNMFLERLSRKAGISFKVSSHDLRKYFATNLKIARVNDPAFNETLIEYWQGHSLGKVKGAYFIPPVEEQLRLYKLAEPRLEPIY